MMDRLLNTVYRWMQGFIPCLLIVVMAGCRAQAPVVITEDTDSTGTSIRETDTQKEVSADWQANMQQFYQSWQEKLTSITGEWQREEYSKPDSTGTQYKTATVSGSFGGTQKEQSRDSMTVNIDLQGVQTEITRVNERLDEMAHVLSNLSAERKASISWWQAALMCLGGLLAVGVLIKLFWRKLP